MNRPGLSERRKASMKAYVQRTLKKRKAYWKAYHARPDRKEANRLYCGVYYRGHKEEQRAKYFLKKYGILIEAYDKMLEDQAGVCAICSNTPKKNRRLSLDHCHATGTVRGLLCDSCNQAIGLLRDNVKLLQSASDYLVRFTKPTLAQVEVA